MARRNPHLSKGGGKVVQEFYRQILEESPRISRKKAWTEAMRRGQRSGAVVTGTPVASITAAGKAYAVPKKGVMAGPIIAARRQGLPWGRILFATTVAGVAIWLLARRKSVNQYFTVENNTASVDIFGVKAEEDVLWMKPSGAVDARDPLAGTTKISYVDFERLIDDAALRFDEVTVVLKYGGNYIPPDSLTNLLNTSFRLKKGVYALTEPIGE